MPEIRLDPLTGLRAIVATQPGELGVGDLEAAPPAAIDASADPFAEGHEERTAAELFAVRPGGGAPDTPGWTVRVIPGPGPALSASAPAPQPDSHPALFTTLPARGAHELIVNTPRSVVSLGDLSADAVRSAVDVWRERMRVHTRAAYVHLGVDERSEAGGREPHSHAELHAFEYVPAIVARERERFGAHAMRTMGANLLEDLVQEEVRRRERIVAIDDEAVLSCPYASQHEFQLMLAPRRRNDRFEGDGPSGAGLLHDALLRLRRRFGAIPPVSIYVRTAPRDAERFCWRIDIVPRLTRSGELALGTGTHVNTVAPEQAASELREA